MPQVSAGAGEEESEARLRLFSSFLHFWSLKKTAQTFPPTLHREEGSRFRGLGLAFPGTAPACAGANLGAQSCAPAQESAGLCRLLFGGRGALCFLEGAKTTVTTWLGCCDRWHSVLWGCAVRNGAGLLPPSAGAGRPRAAGVRGSPGESPAALHCPAVPSQRRGITALRLGSISCGIHVLPKELAPCSEGREVPACPPSGAGARPGPPGLSFRLANHRAGLGKARGFGFGC